MGFMGDLAKQILLRVVKPEMEQIAKDVKEAVAQTHKAASKAEAAVTMVKELRRQMSAAMAIDVGLREAGKVIILTRINGQDRVKIVDTKPQMTLAEYRQLVESLESEYGAKATWVDGPPGAEVMIRG